MKYLLIGFFLILSQCLFSQLGTLDVLTKLNGEVIEINITEIGDDVVTYNYPKESLKYSISKSEILKIVFASGRTQEFNKSAVSPDQNGSVGNIIEPSRINRNMVAILPVTFIGTDNTENDIVGNRAQTFLFQKMAEKKNYQLQNVGSTNSLLRKNGINESNIMNYGFDELANILGVGYVVSSNITFQVTGSSTISGSSRDNDINIDKNKIERTESTYGYSTTSNSKKTIVDLTIYDHKGNLNWTKSKTSIFGHSEAYELTLKFLVKKLPSRF